MKRAISLFTSVGIGDLGLKANNIETVIACELLEERAKLFVSNYPESTCFVGDIWTLENQIVENYTSRFEDAPFLIIATPPCQGMSMNGMGKLLSDYRKGLKPEFDERNRLIIPTIHIIKRLRPKWIIMENVANMINTLIYDEEQQLVNIIDYILREIGDEYVGIPKIVDFADYGVPQNRKRLLSIFTRSEKGTNYFRRNNDLLPLKTHSKEGDLLTKKWITLRDKIFELPPLTASKGLNYLIDYDPLHKVPLLDDKKLFWIRHTKEGESAFNNQCINSQCMYQRNTTHGSTKHNDGINRYNNDTPLYCEKCGYLLPRPYVYDDKTHKKRIMKGFVSAYKRMRWDEPSSTLTTNFQYVSSDNKVHPTQDRTLSLLEGTIIQTIKDYDYKFVINGKIVNDSLIRDAIGESVPPLIIDLVCKNIIHIENF